MYYLFITKKEDIDRYRNELFRVMGSINSGKTPVFCETRSAKTNLIESIPYNTLCGAMLIVGTMLMNRLDVPDAVSVAIVLIINSFCGCVSNYVFVHIKHRLRISLCKRIGVEPSEEVFAAMESLEYQSV